MSVSKLMSRIIAPSHILSNAGDMECADKRRKQEIADLLHDHTFGITSDPLTQFACVFSALIHDADHVGLPNARLAVEDPELAFAYDHRSIAEQKSLDMSWELLMEPRFRDFLSTLCATKEELQRFRHLVVNSVMATDIVDKELGAARKARWDKAFAKDNGDKELAIQESEVDAVDRKATIGKSHRCDFP